MFFMRGILNNVVFVYPKFSQSNVLIVGDVMLDRYWHGDVKNVASELSSVPVVQINFIEERPGGAANVAMNVASLGGRSKLIGLVGIDVFAKALKDSLVKAHVEYDLISVINCTTISKLRVISNDQQLLRLDFEHYFSEVDALSILNHVSFILSHFDVVVLSDYAKGSLAYIKDIISLARNIGIPVLVDPKGSDFSRYRGATILTPNLSEFEAIVDHCDNENMLIKRGMDIIVDYELSALLITCSEKGMVLLRLGKDPLRLPSKAKMIHDEIGAGDTVIAVLAAALSSGSTIEESCVLANLAAGIVVGKYGVSTVSSTELYEVVCKI